MKNKFIKRGNKFERSSYDVRGVNKPGKFG